MGKGGRWSMGEGEGEGKGEGSDEGEREGEGWKKGEGESGAWGRVGQGGGEGVWGRVKHIGRGGQTETSSSPISKSTAHTHVLKEPTCRAFAPGTVSWELTAVGGRDTPALVSHAQQDAGSLHSQIHTNGLQWNPIKGHP